MAGRVTYLVDGFNLYHSVRQAVRDGLGPDLRWLDLNGLLSSYLSIFGSEAVLHEVQYFTAYAHHLTPQNPNVVSRHQAYVAALESTGVKAHVARFKRKDVYCPNCKTRSRRHEEKETDVAIALKGIELLQADACDTLVFVSGDTDLAPAIRTAQRLFPVKQVAVAFPHARFNAELQQLADFSFRMRGKQYGSHQLPDPVMAKNGRAIAKPNSW